MIGMEDLVGLANNLRKKRSCVSRRPLPVSKLLSQNYHLLPSQNVQSLGAGGFGESRSSLDANVVPNSSGGGSKFKKLKLKFGGFTHTIHAKSTAELCVSHSDGPQDMQDVHFQDGIDVNRIGSSRKDKRYQGVQAASSTFRKEHYSRVRPSGEVVFVDEPNNSEPLRKSKRVPKRRVLDVGFSDVDDDDDEEIQYLGRLNASKGMDREDGKGDGKMMGWEDLYENNGYVDEEETSEDDPATRNKKLKKGSFDFSSEERKKSIPTTRNRALQYGKDVSIGSSGSLIEFPNGLPPSAPKKQKEKLTEVEQQVKKAEAAQRRRMQAEKAAREAEAEAIRRILGQDSGRKKREKEMKKLQDKLAEGRAANDVTLPPNTIRVVNGPSGTIVTFSKDVGLPTLFNPSPCSYPPPREKCAGPNCTNEYKYRDSKSKLPLCSLNCYKAIQAKSQILTAC